MVWGRGAGTSGGSKRPRVFTGVQTAPGREAGCQAPVAEWSSVMEEVAVAVGDAERTRTDGAIRTGGCNTSGGWAIMLAGVGKSRSAAFPKEKKTMQNMHA